MVNVLVVVLVALAVVGVAPVERIVAYEPKVVTAVTTPSVFVPSDEPLRRHHPDDWHLVFVSTIVVNKLRRVASNFLKRPV